MLRSIGPKSHDLWPTIFFGDVRGALSQTDKVRHQRATDSAPTAACWTRPRTASTSAGTTRSQSVTKHGERKVEWSSTTYVDDEGFNVGETVRVTDKAGRVLSVSVGDVVYLSGPRKGQPAEIGKVKVPFKVTGAGRRQRGWLLLARRARTARRARATASRPTAAGRCCKASRARAPPLPVASPCSQRRRRKRRLLRSIGPNFNTFQRNCRCNHQV